MGQLTKKNNRLGHVEATLFVIPRGYPWSSQLRRTEAGTPLIQEAAIGPDDFTPRRRRGGTWRCFIPADWKTKT